MAALHMAVRQILRYFEYKHLPEPMQVISRDFHTLAHTTANRFPDCPETTVALRKLLEAKDAAVRASLPDIEGVNTGTKSTAPPTIDKLGS